MASPGFVFFMSLIAGLWGFLGVGHLYVGKKRWILIMILGWIILIPLLGSLMSFVFPIINSNILLDSTLRFNIDSASQLFFILAVIYYIVNLIQSLDAYRIVRKQFKVNHMPQP